MRASKQRVETGWVGNFVERIIPHTRVAQDTAFLGGILVYILTTSRVKRLDSLVIFLH